MAELFEFLNSLQGAPSYMIAAAIVVVLALFTVLVIYVISVATKRKEDQLRPYR